MCCTFITAQTSYIMPKLIFTKEEKYDIERIIAATFISDKIGYTYKLNELILKKKGYDM